MHNRQSKINKVRLQLHTINVDTKQLTSTIYSNQHSRYIRLDFCVSLVLLCLRLVFTARCYASAVLAMGRCPCLCLSVSVSVTSRCFTKTAKRRITQTKPHDTGTLVFWCQRSPRNSTGVTPYGGAKCRLGGSNSANFDK